MDFAAGHNNLLLVEVYYVVNMLEEISLHTIVTPSWQSLLIVLLTLLSNSYIVHLSSWICEGGCRGQQIQRQSVLGGLIDSTLLSFHITIVMNTRVSTQFNTYTGTTYYLSSIIDKIKKILIFKKLIQSIYIIIYFITSLFS